MSECEYVRLEVKLHPSVANALTRSAAGHDVSVTEVVRQAVSVLWLIDNELLGGSRLLLDKGGELTELALRWGPEPGPGN